MTAGAYHRPGEVETRAKARARQVLNAGHGLGSLTSRLSSRKAGEVQLKRSGSSQPWSSSHSRTAVPGGRRAWSGLGPASFLSR